MKNIQYIIIAASVAVASCGNKKNDLSAKKAELEKLRTEIAALQSKAGILEKEILAAEPAKDNGKLIETETLTAGEFKSYLSIEGKADAEQSTIATSQVPGTVTAVVVKSGDRVSAGQALAYLDNTALRQNRAALDQQLSFATTLFDKQKRLWQQGVGTEVQYLSAKNQKEALEKNIAALDAQLAMYIVKSPISGTVESVDTKIGQMAAPGIPMFKVVNMSNLKIVAEVAESYSSKINTGDAVEIEFTDINKKTSSRIAFASKIIDPLNRSFRVEIRPINIPDVKPNMLAKLKIADYTTAKAISVPSNAISKSDNESFVMVMVEENGKTVAKRVIVKTGHQGDSRTEILSGLNAGDKVIVTGYQELNDGQTVKLMTADSK
jgi:RND family efflux transporter MFP subunit